jgi:hypothetical protein
MRPDEDLRSDLLDVTEVSLKALENLPESSLILALRAALEDDGIQDNARFCSVLGHD